MERPIDSDATQVIEGDRHCKVVLAEHQVIIDAQTRRLCQFEDIGSARSKPIRAIGRAGQFASQELGVGPIQFQLEYQVMPALPALIRQKGSARDGIVKSFRKCRRSLGSLAGDKVELRQIENARLLR